MGIDYSEVNMLNLERECVFTMKMSPSQMKVHVGNGRDTSKFVLFINAMWHIVGTIHNIVANMMYLISGFVYP